MTLNNNNCVLIKKPNIVNYLRAGNPFRLVINSHNYTLIRQSLFKIKSRLEL